MAALVGPVSSYVHSKLASASTTVGHSLGSGGGDERSARMASMS